MLVVNRALKVLSFLFMATNSLGLYMYVCLCVPGPELG